MTQRSRRLRKKLRLDEFKELGFSVSSTLAFQEESELETFMDDFIAFLEASDLCFGGSFSITRFDGYVTRQKSYTSCSEEDRNAVFEKLNTLKQCENLLVGQLIDSNEF
jgi:hypothetical protein